MKGKCARRTNERTLARGKGGEPESFSFPPMERPIDGSPRERASSARNVRAESLLPWRPRGPLTPCLCVCVARVNAA